MGKKGKKMTEEEKARLPKAFRDNQGRFARRTTEEQRKTAREGGLASGEVRREQRSMRDYMLIIADSPLLPSYEEAHKLWKLPAYAKDNRMAFAMAIFRSALSGNMKAAELVLKILGEWDDTITVNLRKDFEDMIIG